MKKVFLLAFVILFLTGCNKHSNEVLIHIIDVGQGDSILIQTPDNKNMLIDSGDENSGKIVKRYLKKHKISKLHVIIATHPDSDHIGGLDDILYSFDIDKMYMPNKKNNTSSYNDVINACNKENIDIINAYKGMNFNLGSSVFIDILSPSTSHGDTNLNSIVLNLSYENKDFLFTGDAEYKNENDIINNYNLEDVDFLKVGHHGSKTSTSDIFLKNTSPDVAVISCGYKNRYNHPSQETLDNLMKYDIPIYRTDTQGNLVFYCDGDTIYTYKAPN
jgi:competence protein ComEC